MEQLIKKLSIIGQMLLRQAEPDIIRKLSQKGMGLARYEELEVAMVVIAWVVLELGLEYE